MATNPVLPAANAVPTVKLTKEMIAEMKLAINNLKGKEIEQGKLVDMNPGVKAAWYIAYST